MDLATLIIVTMVVLAIASLWVGATVGVPGVVKEPPQPKLTAAHANGEPLSGQLQQGAYGRESERAVATRRVTSGGMPDDSPRMQPKVMAGVVTLAVGILVVGAYLIWQPARESFAANRQLQDGVDSGAKLFTIECARCHGPTGTGPIGPNLQLNELAARYKWNPNDPADLAKLRDLVTNTITHGRPSTVMSAWGRDDGGPLNQTQISSLADLIMTNSWSAVVPAPAAASAPTAAPAAGSTPVAGSARALITKYSCGACHTIAGVPGAFGTVGPNLSKEGTVPKIPSTSRNLDNTPENMQRWVFDAPSIKPGVVMPNFSAIGMSDAEAKTIADYLETLR